MMSTLFVGSWAGGLGAIVCCARFGIEFWVSRQRASRPGSVERFRRPAESASFALVGRGGARCWAKGFLRRAGRDNACGRRAQVSVPHGHCRLIPRCTVYHLDVCLGNWVHYGSVMSCAVCSVKTCLPPLSLLLPPHTIIARLIGRAGWLICMTDAPRVFVATISTN
jgi:hypothetical protein